MRSQTPYPPHFNLDFLETIKNFWETGAAQGISTSVLSFGLSQTYYWQISKDTKISDLLSPFRNTISNKLGWLKAFTFLLI